MPWNSNDDVLFAAHLRSAQAHIDAALEALRFDGLVIGAGSERLKFLDDQAYPYSQNPWFNWLVPVAHAPGSLLLLVPARRPRLLFVAPEDYWSIPPALPEDPWTGLFEIQEIRDPSDIVPILESISGNVVWIGDKEAPVSGWEVNPPSLLAQLEQARCLKSPYELACMREATAIGVAGHLAAERSFRQGAAEFDIHLAFLAAVRQTDQELPYPPIIALNEHAATLHYQRREVRAPGRLLSLLIDAGAGCRGYASDITRSWAMGPGLFASLIDGVHALQQELCAAVAPGADWRELHLRAHWLVARLLREAGVLDCDPQLAVDSGISAAFLPHGLGHLLGIQVHDVGGFRPAADAEPIPRPPGHPALRLTRRLEPGMVVTVEPGIYFIDSLLAKLKAGPQGGSVNWPLVERLAPYGGIRIEDNVLVTASGHENLTRTAFADVS